MSKAKWSGRKRGMAPVHSHAAAIDIDATLHVAAVGPDRGPEPVRSFGTFTVDLHRLAADWFECCGVTTVAMESTGVYWIPVYEVLEQRGFAVVLVNARDARHVPGRKTDVSDAEWLQKLHEYGLLRASFHPEARIAALWDYLRQRERQRWSNCEPSVPCRQHRCARPVTRHERPTPSLSRHARPCTRSWASI